MSGRAGDAPISAAEGYIRQVIGWREYMRGIYFREGPEYTRRNTLGLDRASCLRSTGPVRRSMACLSADHHPDPRRGLCPPHPAADGRPAILRCWLGLDPYQVHEWYLAVYADAYEWVEAPNVIGMSQYADGGIVGSKPYVSGGGYLKRMSDYCNQCAYDVGEKTGDSACPYNYLYWDFLHRHRDRFGKNPRMAQMYRTWMRIVGRQARGDACDG